MTPGRRLIRFASEDDVIADVQSLRKGYKRVGSWSLPQMAWHLNQAVLARMKPGPHAADTPEQTERKPLLQHVLAMNGYLPDGNVDPTFGFAGQVDATFYVASLLLQPDDKLVAAGDHVLARYLPDGNPDLGFGIGGQVVTQIGVAALIQEPRGRIVAAGESSGAFALARYLPDGTVDTTFGDGGQVSTDFRELDVALALVRQPDGKLVAAGFTEFRDPDTTRDIALARYDSDLLAGPPANREACKHRRWRTFAVPRAFTNQGDCIQLLNTGK